MREMVCSERAIKAPAGVDGGQRADHEAPRRGRRVRNYEPALAPSAAAPGNDVEIEDARTPATSAATAEVALNCLQLPQHLRRFERAFHQSDGIGEVPAGAAMRWIEHDGRGIE